MKRHQKNPRPKRRVLRFLGYLFSVGSIVFIALVVAAGYVLWDMSKTLPDASTLKDYAPDVVTRVHAADGSLLAEYARQKRLFVPVAAMPPRLIHAFISAEDKNFYRHPGIDPMALARAIVQNLGYVIRGRKRRFVGASTITQQVAKNFLLTNERTLKRKIREALIALKLEATFSKDYILELYLNQIYLGRGVYGVAAAALAYFGKRLDELSVDEMAFLASLPKKPGRLDPVRNHDEALARRNWVLGQMLKNGYISREEYEKAVKRPLRARPRPFGVHQFSALSFTEEVRRQIIRLYGSKALYTGGLSVRTTLDPKLQIVARQALTSHLVRFDRQQGFRGPIGHVDLAATPDWGKALLKYKLPKDMRPWSIAVVLELRDDAAVIGLRPEKGNDGRYRPPEKGIIPLALMKWARPAHPKKGGRKAKAPEKPADALKVGDVVYVAPAGGDRWHLMQVPEVQGAMVVMDPHTGRVKALVGGFSHGLSQFNRAVQARRQPGSAIKPFVYAAALDNGYTPASVVLDAPLTITLPNGETYTPRNYTKKYYGPSTLRRGIEQSRNVMTVRLALDMGLDKFTALAEKLGVYKKLPAVPAMALGAGETTLMKLTTAYAVLANGGKKVTASLIDRVQDRYGHTVWRHDTRECPRCPAEKWEHQPEPEIIEHTEELINPYTAYQITSMMEGVVRRGTAKNAFKDFPWPVAGKTGTTSDYKDAWFIGYTPDLVVGVYVGYDKPRTLGKGGTGGHLAAPIVADFLRRVLKGRPPVPFRTPPDMQFIPIDPKTGKRASFGDPGVILEAFKPGEEPPEDDAGVIGAGTGAAAANDNAGQGAGVAVYGGLPDGGGGGATGDGAANSGDADAGGMEAGAGNDGDLTTGTGGLY